MAAGLGETPRPTVGLLSVSDARVRVTGVTVPRAGAVLVRLQSFAEEPVGCLLTPGFPLARAQEADHLGEPGRDLDPAPEDGAVRLALPRLGTGAALLEPTGP